MSGWERVGTFQPSLNMDKLHYFPWTLLSVPSPLCPFLFRVNKVAWVTGERGKKRLGTPPPEKFAVAMMVGLEPFCLPRKYFLLKCLNSGNGGLLNDRQEEL